MIYVALLRGINVGGNNKVDMKQLKVTFEKLNLKHVVTYINTGNIIFTEDQRGSEQLTNELEQAIANEYGFSIRVVIRTFDEIENIMNALPLHWLNNDEIKSDVLYLLDEINNEAVLEELTIVPEIDEVMYVAGAVLWSYNRKFSGRSGMNKLIGTKLYKLVTIRNVNTARKIFTLMQAAKQ